MLNHQHFLTRINAEPDNVLHREVYADWLEEQGDVRADYLRMELEFACFNLWSVEAATLRERLRERCQTIDADWLRALGYTRCRPVFGSTPDAPKDRWALLRVFIESWYAPPEGASFCDLDRLHEAHLRLGVPIPQALCDWFTLGFALHPFASLHHQLLPPEEWEVSQEWNAMIFARECQGCESLGISLDHLEQPDPVVWQYDAGLAVTDSITHFAMLWWLDATKYNTDGGWYDNATPALMEQLDSLFAKANVPMFGYGRFAPEIYEGPDLLMETEAGSNWFHIAAFNGEALQQLPDEVVRNLQ